MRMYEGRRPALRGSRDLNRFVPNKTISDTSQDRMLNSIIRNRHTLT